MLTLINGLGATPLLELYIAQRRLQQVLAGRGMSIGRSLVGEFFTALEMAGFSITMLKLDEELKEPDRGAGRDRPTSPSSSQEE